MDFTPLATEGEGEGGGAVVDLGFFAGFALHAPDGFLGVGIGGFEPGNDAFDRGVTEAEVMLVDEVLPDAFGVEPWASFFRWSRGRVRRRFLRCLVMAAEVIRQDQSRGTGWYTLDRPTGSTRRTGWLG